MIWGAIQSVLSILALPATSAHSVSPNSWTSAHKLSARDATRQLWGHGFQSYMQHAFPLDELKPLSCSGQGPDWKDVTAIHFNDVNANVSLTLIDNLDTFVVLGNYTGFELAVRAVIDNVSFDVDTKPQVFEITIRALGGLLSGHLFASEAKHGFQIPWYNGELLKLAYDLGTRLLPAFETPTGIPYARINLRSGIKSGESVETCSAGAGSLLLEFTALSRWTGDLRFEVAAKRAFFAVWNRRSPLGLLGNGINVKSGAWIDPINSGIGAGIDSFYEYALKMYVMTGEEEYLDVWNESYAPIMKHSRGGDGFWYRTVGTFSGEPAVQHIDSLGAFWPGLQVLAGDIDNAIKAHLAYWNLWKRFSGIPETFNIMTRQPISLGYPLRPGTYSQLLGAAQANICFIEFIESTYFLYRATRDSFYLDVGERILDDLTRRTRVPCGLTTISNLLTNTQENRMESFALSESLKYLYLLFDEDNFLSSDNSPFIFTTEGHMLSLGSPTSGISSSRFINQSIASPVQSSFIPPLSSHLSETKTASFDLSSQFTCPPYTPPSLWALSTQAPGLEYLSTASSVSNSSSRGIVGSIRDRSDFEYARVLSGISVSSERAFGMGFPQSPSPGSSDVPSGKTLAIVTAEDQSWWRPDGWCEVPKAEPYVLDWIVSPGGGFALEDRHPSAEKLTVVDGGFKISNISGLYIQVTARIDLSGYEVTRVGPHKVLPGQKLWIHDPSLSEIEPAPGSQSPPVKISTDTRTPDIYLRFALAPTGDTPHSSNPSENLVVDAMVATSTFGGNPAYPRLQSNNITTKPWFNTKPPPKKPLMFGPESPYNGAIRVLRTEPHNLEGCDDHHPGLRFGHFPTMDEIRIQNQNPESSTEDEGTEVSAAPASVLWVHRGGCSFLRKIVAAKEVGFDGVIVWNTVEDLDIVNAMGGLINPSIDEADRPYAEKELGDVAMVFIGLEDGKRVEELLFGSQSDAKVVVEVFPDPPPSPFDNEDVDWDLLNAELGIEESDILESGPPEAVTDSDAPARILYVNGLAIRNALLV